MVTVNYRLGALGFLCLGSDLVTMNRDPFSICSHFLFGPIFSSPLSIIDVSPPTALVAQVPGNAGLRDQSLALHWVKENIGQFGGDAGW